MFGIKNCTKKSPGIWYRYEFELDPWSIRWTTCSLNIGRLCTSRTRSMNPNRSHPSQLIIIMRWLQPARVFWYNIPGALLVVTIVSVYLAKIPALLYRHLIFTSWLEISSTVFVIKVLPKLKTIHQVCQAHHLLIACIAKVILPSITACTVSVRTGNLHNCAN